MVKLSLKKVREAIKNSKGSKTIIAKKCDVSRMGLWKFLEKYPELEKDIEDERDKVIDLVEARLYDFALEGKRDSTTLNSIKMILAKNRGYSEKSELETTHKGEGIILVIKDANRNIPTDKTDNSV